MNLYFSRGGFPCCICSTQIHFLCFPGKLESAVIPHRRAHLSLFTWQSLRWDNIWHILAVGTELLWSLKKKKSEKTFSRRNPQIQPEHKTENASVCDRCQETCVICVPSKTSVCWVVCACDPLKPSSTSQGVQWELKRKRWLSGWWLVKSTALPFSLSKNKTFFYTRQGVWVHCQSVRQNSIHQFSLFY